MRRPVANLFLLAIVAPVLFGATLAHAGDCPGNPDALGTSRTLVVDPKDHPRIGTMQYGETLPLDDHEVVLTFDDGPLPAHTNPVLDILASQCVKATFFMVGRMAKEFPQDVRRVYDAGHTIGTHSESHPFYFGDLPADRMAAEIDDGVAHVGGALADPSQLAPFFRIPGLRRGDNLEAALSQRGLMTWSADFPADDWRHISSAQVVHFALSRLEAKGKGVLLLHDIQARTQAALPVILRGLKERGYRIVHVVAATPDRPKTATEPAQWVPHWIHPAVASAKPGEGFTLNAADVPSRAMPRSARSVWLLRQPRAQRIAIFPAPDTLRIGGTPARLLKFSPSQPGSVVRIPGSSPLQPDDKAFRPFKTGSRVDSAEAPRAR